MYNKLLDTFLAVADCGSLTRAAEKLHLSPPAVIKQMNQLEEEIGTVLFQRTSKGVILTEAGKACCEESRRLIHNARKAVHRIQVIGTHSSHQVRLGTSLLHSAQYFFDIWSRAYGTSLEHRVNIIPFLDNSFDQYMDVVKHLGEDVDIVAAAYPRGLLGYHCNAIQIAELPFCCAVPNRHRLVDRQVLELSDLYGESILMLDAGRDPDADQVRAELERHPEITLINVPDYDPSTFNHSEATNQILISRECFKRAHPMLKTIPLNLPYSGPYGLLYSSTPSKDTLDFINVVKRQLKNKQE